MTGTCFSAFQSALFIKLLIICAFLFSYLQQEWRGTGRETSGKKLQKRQKNLMQLGIDFLILGAMKKPRIYWGFCVFLCSCVYKTGVTRHRTQDRKEAFLGSFGVKNRCAIVY